MSHSTRYDALRQTTQELDEGDRLRRAEERADALKARQAPASEQTAQQTVAAPAAEMPDPADLDAYDAALPGRVAELGKRGIHGREAMNQIRHEDAAVQRAEEKAEAIRAGQAQEQGANQSQEKEKEGVER